MKRLLLLLALSLAATAAHATSTFMNGNKLLALCQAEGNRGDLDEILCLGYVQGIADGYEAMSRVAKALGGDAAGCIRHVIEVRQVRDVIVRHLQEHPEQRHYPAASLSIIAITKAFCPEEEPIAHPRTAAVEEGPRTDACKEAHETVAARY
jgi:hypothetical protein